MQIMYRSQITSPITSLECWLILVKRQFLCSHFNILRIGTFKWQLDPNNQVILDFNFACFNIRGIAIYANLVKFKTARKWGRLQYFKSVKMSHPYHLPDPFYCFGIIGVCNMNTSLIVISFCNPSTWKMIYLVVWLIIHFYLLWK